MAKAGECRRNRPSYLLSFRGLMPGGVFITFRDWSKVVRRGVTFAEIALITFVKGVIFETFHQLKERSLRRKARADRSPEQPAHGVALQNLLSGRADDFRPVDQKLLESRLPRLGKGQSER